MAVFELGGLVSRCWLPPGLGAATQTALTGMVAGIGGAALVCAVAGSVPVAVGGHLLPGGTQGPHVAATMSVRSETRPRVPNGGFRDHGRARALAGALGPPLVGVLAGARPRWC